jgi:hypothetical protein
MRIIMGKAKSVQLPKVELYEGRNFKRPTNGPVISLDDMPETKRVEMLRLYGNVKANAGSVRHDEVVSEVMTELAEENWPGVRFIG